MKNLVVSMDSGAYSLYNVKFAPSKQGLQVDRGSANYDYLNNPEFTQYLDDYCAFLFDHEDDLEFYVNVDIIYNPEATLEVQAYMESCGLNPIPVFHYGEPIELLRHYIDNYEYIGVGGLGQKASVQSYIEFGDRVFKEVCNKHGTPRVKVHGFAMTAFQLMERYPWYSCDSSTWTSLSRNGWTRFPRLQRDGTYDFLRKPIAWRFTERSRDAKQHIDKQSEIAKRHMAWYLEEMFGFTMEQMASENYFYRDVANAGHTLLMGQALKKYYEERWGWGQGANLYLAGHPGAGMKTSVIRRELTWVQSALEPGSKVHYLGSFFYPRESAVALDALKPSTRRELK